MDILLQLALGTVCIGVVAGLLRRVRQKSKNSIETGTVSPGWLVENRVRRRDRGTEE